MGFRFRKIFRLVPGVRLNLSKGGISTSVKPRGATFNFGARGTRFTAGLPGSGMFYSWFKGHRGNAPVPISDMGETTTPPRDRGWCGCLVLVAVIFVSVSFWSKKETPEPAASNPPEVRLRALVVASKLNCRTSAAEASDVVAQWPKDAEVEIIRAVDGWSLIRRENQMCWVSSRFLAQLN